MASYITLTIDTLSPTIEIFAPPFTTRETLNTIIVKSDEPLSDFQDFYFVDSNNTVYDDYTFFLEDEYTYVGQVKLHNAPVGIITFFGRVKDEVGNQSNLMSTTINVLEESRLLKLEVSHRSMEIAETTKQMTIADKVNIMPLNVKNAVRKIEQTHRKQNIDTRIEEQ